MTPEAQWVITVAVRAFAFGVVAVPAFVLYVTATDFRRRLKDDVGRWKALKVFPRYTYGHWKWRQTAGGTLLFAVVFTVAMAVLAVFITGLKAVLGI